MQFFSKNRRNETYVLKFSILGTLQINTADGPAEISGELQRTLAQTLLVGEGRAIPGEILMDEMWGENPPDHQANAFQAHISRLRRRLRALEPENPHRLLLSPSGYRLVLKQGELDAVEFTRGVKEAEAIISDDPAAAAEKLRTALGYWQGPVIGTLPDGQMCRLAAARYEELRLRAMELLFHAQLALDNHSAILVELHDTHARHPLRERFCQQLMVALYRAGRQADALDTYRRMWRRLSEELGVRPSPDLQRVEHAILSHDAGLIADR